jgi:hypothetical protein
MVVGAGWRVARAGWGPRHASPSARLPGTPSPFHTPQALLITLYRDEPLLMLPYRFLAALVDLDEQFTIWRYRHALMVQRQLGSKVGTGGSSGYQYLRATAERHKVFTDLNALPTFLIPRMMLPPLPDDVKAHLAYHFNISNAPPSSTLWAAAAAGARADDTAAAAGGDGSGVGGAGAARSATDDRIAAAVAAAAASAAAVAAAGGGGGVGALLGVPGSPPRRAVSGGLSGGVAAGAGAGGSGSGGGGVGGDGSGVAAGARCPFGHG